MNSTELNVTATDVRVGDDLQSPSGWQAVTDVEPNTSAGLVYIHTAQTRSPYGWAYLPSDQVIVRRQAVADTRTAA